MHRLFRHQAPGHDSLIQAATTRVHRGPNWQSGSQRAGAGTSTACSRVGAAALYPQGLTLPRTCSPACPCSQGESAPVLPHLGACRELSQDEPVGRAFQPGRDTCLRRTRRDTVARHAPLHHRAMHRRRRRRASVHTTFAGIAINHVPGFITAQSIGATCAALVAKVLFEPAQSG